MANLERISVKDSAKILNVSTQTVRLWEKEGKLTSVRTEGNHRRYLRSDIEKLAGTYTPPQKQKENRVAIYCRVSSHEQKVKGDLERQVGRMTSEAIKRKYCISFVFDEVGSGMNDKRKKLIDLLEKVKLGEVDIVMVEHKDRLSRFCFNYLVQFCAAFNVQIICVDEVLGKGYEQELVEDILSLMASFSAKIYGRRSHQNKKKK